MRGGVHALVPFSFIYLLPTLFIFFVVRVSVWLGRGLVYCKHNYSQSSSYMHLVLYNVLHCVKVNVYLSLQA